MTIPTAQIQLLVAGLHELGVDPGVLQKVSVHLPANCENPDQWGELAAALRRTRNYTAAELVYKTALGIHGNSARLWNNYGILLRDWGKLDAALRAFERAIELDESYAKALANKANVFERLHQFADARKWYQAALALDPTDAGTANNIGVCLLGEGNKAEAEASFEKTLRLDPQWANALFNLTLLKLGRGDFTSAEPLVDRLSRLLPDDPDVKKLEARLREKRSEPIKMPGAQKLESDMNPAVRRLAHELAGNPRSVFISYAWSDPETSRFAARLSQDLQSRAFQVVLDREHELEVDEILFLLLHCQNVVVLNDTYYAESCLLGKVPISKTTSEYPSFAFPLAAAQSQEYLETVFKISAVAWDLARRVRGRGLPINDFAFQLADPKAFEKTPGLRLFIEGWRVDEIQMVFANLKRLRTISIAYLGGSHCLAGYPLFDFSRKEYYAFSFAALHRFIDLAKWLTVDAPIEFERPDWRGYRWPDSPIVSSKLWKIAPEDVAVWRPSLTPSGEAAAIIQQFKDWEPL